MKGITFYNAALFGVKKNTYILSDRNDANQNYMVGFPEKGIAVVLMSNKILKQ